MSPFPERINTDVERVQVRIPQRRPRSRSALPSEASSSSTLVAHLGHVYSSTVSRRRTGPSCAAAKVEVVPEVFEE